MSNRGQFNQLSVVLIDDNPDHMVLMSNALEQAFSHDGNTISIKSFEEPANGLAELTNEPQQIILLDYQFSGSTGVDWISDFVKLDTAPVILITSSGDEHIAAQAFRAGASDYIVKSEVLEKPSLLRRSVLESLRKFGLERTNRDLANKLKHANRELQRKNTKLSELTHTAHRFVEDVAHEFRTPLTVIKEFASIIDDGIGGPVSEKQSEYLKHIISSTGDLAELVNDFLNCSRLRSNNICIHRQENRAEDLINTVRPILHSRATSKSIHLVYELENNLPPVFVDADKAQRSLINLVINAIKYSSSDGTVRIRVECADEYAVRISVRDEGAGLPPQSVKQLFDRFRQGGSDDGHLANGFGLGLCIVSELVSINYGQIDVESELGSGSTFSFTLPRASVPGILHGLIKQAGRGPAQNQIAVFSAQREHEHQSIDQLIKELSTACMPLDIAIPSPDGSAAYLIGITSSQAQFRERITQAVNKRRAESGNGVGPLVLDHLGSWAAAHAFDRILNIIPQLSESEVQHAEVRAHH